VERGDWEPNSEDIDGFDDEHNDVTTWDPRHTVLKELSTKILSERGMGHPLSRSP
jgi:hypothetical protein